MAGEKAGIPVESGSKKPNKDKKKADLMKGLDSILDPIVADGGRLVKMEVDYSNTCDEKIPIAKSLAISGKLQEGLDVLMALEKQTRTVSRLINLEGSFAFLISVWGKISSN